MRDDADKPASQPAPNAGRVPMTEEMDSAKWSLPPALPVLIVLVVLGILIGAYSWHARPKPTSQGAITRVAAAEQKDQSGVMVVLHLRLQNVGQRPLWLRSITAQLKTDQGEWSDDAASAVDFERYFQAFPELRQHQIPPLKPETKIAPGAQEEGMVIVAFPVGKEAFDKRKSLSAKVEVYDQRPLVISEKQ